MHRILRLAVGREPLERRALGRVDERVALAVDDRRAVRIGIAPARRAHKREIPDTRLYHADKAENHKFTEKTAHFFN